MADGKRFDLVTFDVYSALFDYAGSLEPVAAIPRKRDLRNHSNFCFRGSCRGAVGGRVRRDPGSRLHD